MRKSKYLIINSFYFDFNDDLSEIITVKELFKKQNILDLERFNKLISIKENQFEFYNLNFLYLPKNIEIMGKYVFLNNQIQLLDLSNYINLRIIKSGVFSYNQIKQLKLPKNIEILDKYTFSVNQIEILDLSNCIKLKEILSDAFSDNPLKEIKILGNIEIEYDNYYKKDIWNIFARYYNDNEKKAGDYKLENNEWKWYPL